ncbi:hypothetical protein KPSA3_07598 [Pseudomonas syringae pv. actinidiae]|uniref:Uncharacterized protein n=1 Tax=Pseudomonas syringae pv. actinidiae TaxID=103796 RepID=A0AAN4QDA1_PSESF|nr:hypothetical protein KPSA3_07598 [Pseudomonas syringae pv. actinidiae]
MNADAQSGCLTAAPIALFDAEQWIRTAVRIIEDELNGGTL